MVNVILVRHAKTQWNIEKRVQGRTDIPLAPESIKETEVIAARSSFHEVSAVYSSPLSRAYDTAVILTGKTGLPVIKDERLIERDFGELEGEKYESQEFLHSKLLLNLDDVKGAESQEELFKRAKSFLDDILSKHNGETVFVASHGAILSYIIYALSHSSFSEKDYDPTYIGTLSVFGMEYGE